MQYETHQSARNISSEAQQAEQVEVALHAGQHAVQRPAWYPFCYDANVRRICTGTVKDNDIRMAQRAKQSSQFTSLVYFFFGVCACEGESMCVP